MSIFFTSDSHWNHRNICKGCSDWPDKETSCRDFNTIEEHDNFLLNEINKVVRPSDILYHLGDFGFAVKQGQAIKDIRAKIACETIYLAKGNHDHIFEHKKYGPEVTALFKQVKDIYYKKIDNQFVVMCHYAMRTWPWQHHGSWMLFGHSHSNLADDPNSLSLDVGVDTCLYGHKKYTPYSMEELRHIMDNHKQFVPVDHHK